MVQRKFLLSALLVMSGILLFFPSQISGQTSTTTIIVTCPPDSGGFNLYFVLILGLIIIGLIGLGFVRNKIFEFIFAIFGILLLDYEIFANGQNISVLSGGCPVSVPVDPLFLGVLSLMGVGLCIASMAYLILSKGGGA